MQGCHLMASSSLRLAYATRRLVLLLPLCVWRMRGAALSPVCLLRHGLHALRGFRDRLDSFAAWRLGSRGCGRRTWHIRSLSIEVFGNDRFLGTYLPSATGKSCKGSELGLVQSLSRSRRGLSLSPYI